MTFIDVLIVLTIGIGIGMCISAIIAHCRDDRREEHLRDIYDHRIKTLEKDIQFWRDKCLINGCSQHTIDTYKDILSHFLNGPSKTTDSIFMFEGAPYKPKSFDLSREEGRLDTLTVEFVSTKFDI